jgi:hypothetical protein
MTYDIGSYVAVTERETLETLLFFNPAQEIVHSSILDGISRFGHPRLVETKSGLTVQVGMLPTQTLFAFSRTGNIKAPVALVIFCRESSEELTIVHIAVDPSHSLSAKRADGAAMVLVGEVRRIASTIAGIQRIRLAYLDLTLRLSHR